MEDLLISTNWICEDENKLKNFIRLDNKRCGIENVNPETCVCLTKGENEDSESKPTLDLKMKDLIKELKVFSEGSLIEVFGIHDEYLFTCVADFMDDWEGMAVYQANIVLPNINTCRLKFSRIKDPQRLWLYSMEVSIIKAEEQPNGSFNMENINKLINNSSQQLSEKAEKFKNFFELYAKNSSATHAFNVQSLLNVINRECNAQLSDAKAFLNFLNGSDNSGRKENTLKGKEMSVECLYLKDYIDGKFAEMKEALMKSIDYKLAEFRVESNTKLDKIIELLKKSKM